MKVFLDQLDGGTHLIADHTGPGRHGHCLLLVDWREEEGNMKKTSQLSQELVFLHCSSEGLKTDQVSVTGSEFS